MDQKLLALIATLLLPMLLPLLIGRAGIRVPKRKWAVWYVFWVVLASLLAFQIFTIEHILWVEPTHIDFGQDLKEISFFVSNNGSGVIRWVVEGSIPPWLQVDPLRGDTVGGEKDFVRVSLNRTALDPGRSSVDLYIAGRAGENETITITASK